MPANFNPDFVGYTNQGAFRFWCQKVLPLVYDDSLSYYELLNKVVNYLNNVIADVANVETNLNALHTAYGQLENYTNEQIAGQRQYILTWVEQMRGEFTTLQNFVNDYFDNLDVQQEINNKLDTMATDGTLSALVRPIIASEAPPIITNWLENNVDPTTAPALDRSLSIYGAAADAGAVGMALKGADNMPLSQYIINNAGVWENATTGRHISIDIGGGDIVTVVARDDSLAVCAFLKSDNAGYQQTADFCDGSEWNTRFVLQESESRTFTAPSDCKLLYIAMFAAIDVSPKSIFVNGVDVGYYIRKRVDELSEQIEIIKDNIRGMEGINPELNKIKNNLDISGLRRTLRGEYRKVNLPEYTHLNGFNLPLYTDGYEYVHTIDLSAYKNQSSASITVHNNAELTNALNVAQSGDTIILDGGFYETHTIRKSINLIGKNNPIFVNNLIDGFTTTGESATNFVYRTVEDVNPSMVLDISNIDKGIILPLVKRTYVADVVSNPGSYIISGGKLYVRLYNNIVPTSSNVLALEDSVPTIKFEGNLASCKWYMEGLTIFGGTSCVAAINSDEYTEQKFIGVNCNFYYSQLYDNVFIRGVNSYLQSCVSMGAYLDGYNYHKRSQTTDLSNALEVDCIAHDNGKRDDNPPRGGISNNGSTIHDGGKIVRINGVYYNNMGANVADINMDTESYNYGCIAFDSLAPFGSTNHTNADFWICGSGKNLPTADMYLYGCKSLGDSEYSLIAFDNGKLHVDSATEYDHNKASGDIISIV